MSAHLAAMLLVARTAAASWWIVTVVLGCGSVIAGTLLAEHFAAKRANPFLAPFRNANREPGELPEVEK